MTSLEALQTIQERLVTLLETDPECESVRMLTQSVPHLVSLIEERVPNANAVILSREDMRGLLIGFVAELLAVELEVGLSGNVAAEVNSARMDRQRL